MNGTWAERLVVAALSSLVTLFVISVFGYYHEQNKKIYPGTHFPVAWAGREVLGDSYDALAAAEESAKKSEFNTQRFHYEQWCEANHIQPRKVDPGGRVMLEFAGQEMK